MNSVKIANSFPWRFFLQYLVAKISYFEKCLKRNLVKNICLPKGIFNIIRIYFCWDPCCFIALPLGH